MHSIGTCWGPECDTDYRKRIVGGNSFLGLNSKAVEAFLSNKHSIFHSAIMAWLEYYKGCFVLTMPCLMVLSCSPDLLLCQKPKQAMLKYIPIAAFNASSKVLLPLGVFSLRSSSVHLS